MARDENVSRQNLGLLLAAVGAGGFVLGAVVAAFAVALIVSRRPAEAAPQGEPQHPAKDVAVGVAGGAGQVAERVAGPSPEVRRIADRPWWRGKVRAENIEAMLDVMTSRRIGTIVANQSGQFCFFEESYNHVKGFEQAARSAHPNEFRQIGTPTLMFSFGGSYGERLSRLAASDFLDEKLKERQPE